MKFQTAYEPTVKPTISCDPEAGAEQHHKEACDVNNILKKYQRTGAIEHRNEHRGEYGFVPSTTFQEAMETVAKAQSMYEELPATIRQQFEGPGRFLEYVQDPNNAENLVKMGLATSTDDIASKTPQKDPTDLQLKPSKEGGSPSPEPS